MQVYSFSPKDHFGSNTYVLQSENEYALIDPSVSLSVIQSKIPDFSPKLIILTHAHFDHMLFLTESKHLFQNSVVLIPCGDICGLTDPIYNASSLFGMKPLFYREDYTAIDDGEKFTLGDEKLIFHEYKGHTCGSCIIEFHKTLFVGDLIFARGSYGRTDLPGGNQEELFSSIRRLFRSFSPDFTVYPGHGEGFKLSDASKYFDYLFRKDI